jgi:2',3'-cyclic-nucleotide 2'-phosphodiesterase (5'-nucleotidase family)
MSNNQDQIARRRATQDVIAANRAHFEERMRHHYKEMDLGEWTPRLSPEERAEKKAAEEKAANVAKIKALAEKAGIGVLLVEDPNIEAKIAATHDGTAETVSQKIERIATDAEEFEALSEEEQAARIADIRDERLAEQADAAVGVV